MVRSSLGLAFVSAIALAGCPKAGDPAAAASDAGDAGAIDARAEAAGEVVEDDDVHPVYPLDAGPVDPRVQRLCSALHDLPEQRRATCCAGTPGLVMTPECTRTLNAAISFHAVTLAASDVDACEEAMKKAFEGCDWVGPFPPEVPGACLGIFKGQIPAGKRCRSSLECADDMRCHGAGPTAQGRCGAASGDGEKCGGSADVCRGTYGKTISIRVTPSAKGTATVPSARRSSRSPARARLARRAVTASCASVGSAPSLRQPSSATRARATRAKRVRNASMENARRKNRLARPARRISSAWADA